MVSICFQTYLRCFLWVFARKCWRWAVTAKKQQQVEHPLFFSGGLRKHHALPALQDGTQLQGVGGTFMENVVHPLFALHGFLEVRRNVF